MYRILVVEDDAGIADAIATQAKMWELETRCVTDFHRVMKEFAAYAPHLVVMDISLPAYDGFYWCREIRKVSKVPILFLSSAADNMNIVMAVNMGGDDFIAKPCDGSVLIAKIQALLRRSYKFAASVSVIEHREAILNLENNTLLYRGEPIELRKNEFRILQTLMNGRGKVVSRESLMEALWKTDSFVDENTLSVNVNRLRKKLDSAGLHDFIVTKFGEGYTIPD